MSAPTELHSERLLLRAPTPALADAVLDYQLRNRAHFAPWDPPYPAGFFERAGTAERLLQGEQAFAAGAAWRYWICPVEAPTRVIGTVHFSQVARGPFQNAILGYSLDERAQGRGLMHEALLTAIAAAFGPDMRLHRIQAAVRPENRRSRAVLERLGFAREGFSPRYLFIAGAWRDHEVFALVNPAWPADEAP